MPDLSQLMQAATSDLDSADGTVQIARRVQRRRRRRLAAGGTAIGIAIAVAVPLAIASGGSDANVNQIVPAATPTSKPVPSAAPYPSATPPKPATAIVVSRPPAGSRLISAKPPYESRGLLYALYSLPGRANANTIPPGGATAENATVIHPATNMQITAQIGVSQLPDLPVVPGSTMRQKKVTVNGNAAVLDYPAVTYGILQLNWIEQNTRFTIRVFRGDTPDGISGIDEMQLLAVANSTSVK